MRSTMRLFRGRAGIAALVLLVAACHPVRGCAESQFLLEEGSRLPVWFAVPPGIPRMKLEVALVYYGPLLPGPRTATIELREKGGRVLERVVATLAGTAPQTMESDSGVGPRPYPLYEVLTVDGVSDVVEHATRGPRFQMTDDRAVRERLGLR